MRSTHGVNCTGSCSWKVYVKDGIITWEAQQTDYPSTGADRPEYEPRGCPRGAAFSWYTYSPTRVRYPYVRGVLLEMYRAAKAEHGGDPVAAWASIVDDPAKPLVTCATTKAEKYILGPVELGPESDAQDRQLWRFLGPCGGQAPAYQNQKSQNQDYACLLHCFDVPFRTSAPIGRPWSRVWPESPRGQNRLQGIGRC